MIYLDNAATSLIKPVGVENAVVNAMRSMASPGRGAHAPASYCLFRTFSSLRGPGSGHARGGDRV